MKTNEELMQLAMQESAAEQKNIDQLYSRLKSQYEREVKAYVDAKVQQLIAGAEAAVKEYYKGEKSATPYDIHRTGIVYVEEGVLFRKKRYYYRFQDGKMFFLHHLTADKWNKFYNVRFDDDNDQINEFYLLDSGEKLKLNRRKYYQYVEDEFKKIITEICSEPRITGRITGPSTGTCSALYWTVNLGYLDDVKK